jgi:hypothetical protein
MGGQRSAVRAVFVLANFLEMPNLRNLLKASYPHFPSQHLPFTLPTTFCTDARIHHTMNYPDTATADLSAFSLWPHALAASEEEMAVWAQPADYAQPGPAVEGIPFDILDAVMAWGQSRTSPAETLGFENNLVSIAFGTWQNLHPSSPATGRPETRWPGVVPAITSLSRTLPRRVPQGPSQPWSCRPSSPTTRAHSVKDSLILSQ